MSILSVDNIQPIGSGTSVTVNSAATLVLNNVDSVGIITAQAGINVSGGTGTFAGDVLIADKIVHTGDTNTAIRFPANDTISFETSGSEALRIDSSGRMGLGTTTLGDVNADNLTIADSANCGITIRSGSDFRGHIFFTDATATQYQGFVRYIHQANEDSLSFGTATLERMRISSSGKVGIGTNNPTEIFNVFGTNVKPVIGHKTDHTVHYSSYDSQNNTTLEISSSGTGTNVAGLAINNPTTSANSSYKTLTFCCSGTSNAEKRGAIITSNHDEDSSSTIKGNLSMMVNNGSGLQTAMLINKEGYVTKPAHPSFYVRRSIAGDGRSAATPITEWSSTYANGAHNQGSHFNTSTGLFTAPVSGIYHFSAAGGYKQASNNFNQKLRLNSTLIAEGTRMINYPDAHSTATISATVYMAAGNTMSLAIETTHHVNTSLNFFSGHLVG